MTNCRSDPKQIIRSGQPCTGLVRQADYREDFNIIRENWPGAVRVAPE